MPLRIRFTGAATNNATLTISWAGGYPPGATAAAIETFKSAGRTTFFQTSTSANPTTQAANFLYAITTDYGANFVATQINNDVIITPRNGTQSITATTTSSNVTINPMVADIQLIGRPQDFTPAYNPVTFKFFSARYAEPGFRYLVDVINDKTDESIASFKVLPIQDGTGYIDISKPLSNLVSVDFNPSASSFNVDQSNSYVKYRTEIGVEYQFNWPYNTFAAYGGTGPYAAKTRLNNTQVVSHAYTVGDQINISTYPTNSIGAVSGLHKIVAIPSATSIVIDTTFPGATAIGASGGITSFADGRKTSIPDLRTESGIAFNGAATFDYLKYFSGPDFMTNESAGDVCVVSSILNNTSDSFGYEEFFMNQYQILDINMWLEPSASGEFEVQWRYLNKAGSVISSGTISIGDPLESAPMRRFRISWPSIVGTLNPNGYALEFAVYEGSATQQIGRNYYIYQDNRCAIETYSIAFMDRYGSIMSYAFPLRSKESGKIERDTYNKSISYNETVDGYYNIYPTTVAGETTYSVNYKKELELNTNWMNDFMSVQFEELLTSPYTWIRLPDGAYYACIVTETGFEVERQKNKRLIRKTVKVRLANENVINI